MVCIPGIGAPAREGENDADEARLLHVAMTRATHQLVMTHSDTTLLSQTMAGAMGVLRAL